jgi:hypothetical protein
MKLMRLSTCQFCTIVFTICLHLILAANIRATYRLNNRAYLIEMPDVSAVVDRENHDPLVMARAGPEPAKPVPAKPEPVPAKAGSGPAKAGSSSNSGTGSEKPSTQSSGSGSEGSGKKPTASQNPLVLPVVPVQPGGFSWLDEFVEEKARTQPQAPIEGTKEEGLYDFYSQDDISDFPPHIPSS